MTDYSWLLDYDLCEWKKKLAPLKKLSYHKWKLVFFSHDDKTPQHKESFGDADIWRFRDYNASTQNQGGRIIATSDTITDLTPASESSAKRLQLFGFVYTICPNDMPLPKFLIQLEDWQKQFLFRGIIQQMFTTQIITELPIPSFDIFELDLTSKDYIDALYAEFQPHGQNEMAEHIACMTKPLYQLECDIIQLKRKQEMFQDVIKEFYSW